ncbi:hypothetical protein YPPY32_5068, partial [Yersinia pestis PY-32]
MIRRVTGSPGGTS